MQQVEPFYASVLIDAIQARHEADGQKPHAFPTPFRHSDAGSCAFYLWLKSQGIEESDPFDPASVWVAWLGTLVHEEWQEEALFNLAGATEELAVMGEDGIASGSLDLEHGKVCVELKTVKDTDLASAVGIYRRGPASKYTKAKGPKANHVIQLALNTVAADSDTGVLIYLAKQAMSIQVRNAINEKARGQMSDKDRFCAEWRFTREELEPIAQAEIWRLKEILDSDSPPEPRAVSDDFSMTDLLDPTGDDWHCLYCTRRTACLNHPQRVTIRGKEEIW